MVLVTVSTASVSSFPARVDPRGVRHLSCADSFFFFFHIHKESTGGSASHLILLIEINCFITACNFLSRRSPRLRFPPCAPPSCSRAALTSSTWDSSVRRPGGPVPVGLCQGCLTFHAAAVPEMFPSVSSPAAHLFPINCFLLNISFYFLLIIPPLLKTLCFAVVESALDCLHGAVKVVSNPGGKDCSSCDHLQPTTGACRSLKHLLCFLLSLSLLKPTWFLASVVYERFTYYQRD